MKSNLKKTICTAIISLTLTILSVLALSSCGGGGGKIKYDWNNYTHEGMIITSVSLGESEKTLIIPDTYKGEKVTGIDANALRSSSLESIVIPAGVRYIPEYVFSDCPNLKSIMIESGNTKYTSIGNCIIDLTTNTLVAGCGASVIPSDGMIKTIGKAAFYEVEGLISVTIPAGVTKIDENAFYGCRNLTEVVIDQHDLTTIERNAFYDCQKLRSISVPGSVTRIGGYAFWNCTSLNDIENGVTYLGAWAIKCDQYAESIRFRDGTVGISPTALENCKVKNLYFPASMRYLPSFSLLPNLENVEMMNGITELSSFDSCKSLKRIVLPKSITEIPDETFKYCTSLEKIELHEGLKKIGRNAFKGCSSLCDITLPESLTELDVACFSGTGITNIEIPGNVKHIMPEAFYDCQALRRAVIHDGVEEIGNNAFAACPSLLTVFIPKSVNIIFQNAFYGCSALTIYAEASSCPSDWHPGFNPYNRDILWNKTISDIPSDTEEEN